MTDKILKHIRKHCRITRPGLLTQDFKTTDNVINVYGYRIGGGFTMGTSAYRICKHGKQVADGLTLSQAYLYTYRHLAGNAPLPEKMP